MAATKWSEIKRQKGVPERADWQYTTDIWRWYGLPRCQSHTAPGDKMCRSLIWPWQPAKISLDGRPQHLRCAVRFEARWGEYAAIGRDIAPADEQGGVPIGVVL